MFMVAVQSLDAFLMFIYVAKIKNGTILSPRPLEKKMLQLPLYPLSFFFRSCDLSKWGFEDILFVYYFNLV